MKWCKLAAGYYSDPAVAAAGEPAEVLFVRGLSWCALHNTGGIIPGHVPNLLCRTVVSRRVRALVEAGLWAVEPDGSYRVVRWESWQSDLSGLDARRANDRQRQARRRSRERSREVTGETRPDQTRPDETRSDESAAAAALPAPPPPAPVEEHLTPRVLDLRRALDAVGLVARWDRLAPTVRADLDALVEAHGVDRLVRAAQASHRPDAPAQFAQAWLGAWRALPEPGSRLRVVRERCDLHLLDEPCRGCAADRLATGS